jgi:ParB family transcriptional regulator, chromosome partitioning protein
MTKKRGLGRGLDALIPSTAGTLWEERETSAQQVVRQIAVDQILPNPHQPRAPIVDEQLTELAASITEHGVIQPVILTQTEEGYRLVAGERRWRAARQAGLATVPALIQETTPQGMLELALVENIQRADLNPLEEANAYRRLIDDYGLTQAQVAGRVGKSRSAVANTVRLLSLPAEVQAALMAGRISEGHARALLGLPTAEAQGAALKTVLERHLSVRQAEELVRRLLGAKPEGKPRPVSPELRLVEERLESQLGTRVQIRHTKRGGRIEIHYYSDEELEALLAQLVGD